jgi:hypothetical protein
MDRFENTDDILGSYKLPNEGVEGLEIQGNVPLLDEDEIDKILAQNNVSPLNEAAGHGVELDQ